MLDVNIISFRTSSAHNKVNNRLYRTITILCRVFTVLVILWTQLLMVIIRRPAFPPTNTHNRMHVTWELASDLLYYCLWNNVCMSALVSEVSKDTWTTFTSLSRTHSVVETCPSAWLREDSSIGSCPISDWAVNEFAVCWCNPITLSPPPAALDIIWVTSCLKILNTGVASRSYDLLFLNEP